MHMYAWYGQVSCSSYQGSTSRTSSSWLGRVISRTVAAYLRTRHESIFVEEIDKLGTDSGMTRSSPDTTRVDSAKSTESAPSRFIKRKKEKKSEPNLLDLDLGLARPQSSRDYPPDFSSSIIVACPPIIIIDLSLSLYISPLAWSLFLCLSLSSLISYSLPLSEIGIEREREGESVKEIRTVDT